MQITLHQTHHSIGDFQGIFAYLQNHFENKKISGLHIFPELYLCGYPLQDLCLQKSFIDRYQEFLTDLDSWCQNKWQADEPLALLLGGLKYTFKEDESFPHKIENVVYLASPGEKLTSIYTKMLLPNYDIFDEAKYFSAGNEAKILDFAGNKIGILICEDMWFSTIHQEDPVIDLKNLSDTNKTPLDLIVNLSASPFHLRAFDKRLERAFEVSHLLKAPFVYVNRVGGEDEILFDGRSFALNGSKMIIEAKQFQKDQIALALPQYKDAQDEGPLAKSSGPNTWESLFEPQLDTTCRPSKLSYLSDNECGQTLAALCFGLQEYAKKSNFKKFLVALSGGIDSALVLAIARLSLHAGQEIEAVYMPGFYSAPESYDLSLEMCKKLGVKFSVLPIKFFHSAIKNAYKESFNQEMQGLADENIQSRLRGSLIYAHSNQTNALVINTSNKSELSVGYSTLYGDSVGAISLLGDLYKEEVFRLSHYINNNYDEIIPPRIIERPPTAELRENQQDSQTLPPYEILDPILEGLLSYRLNLIDLHKNHGFSVKEIQKVYDLYIKSEYKRKQFCPIIKLKQKSFGFGYRVPICKSYISLK